MEDSKKKTKVKLTSTHDKIIASIILVCGLLCILYFITMAALFPFYLLFHSDEDRIEAFNLTFGIGMIVALCLITLCVVSVIMSILKCAWDGIIWVADGIANDNCEEKTKLLFERIDSSL